jgi:hypothetical protein
MVEVAKDLTSDVLISWGIWSGFLLLWINIHHWEPPEGSPCSYIGDDDPWDEPSGEEVGGGEDGGGEEGGVEASLEEDDDVVA